MSPQMAEIDALLKVKEKRRAWKEAKEAKLQELVESEQMKDQVILEDLEKRPGVHDIRVTPTLQKVEDPRPNSDEKGYM